MRQLIDKSYLINIGFREHQAIMIIRLSKKYMVSQGFTFYNNSRLGCVPKIAVEHITGLSLQGDESIEN
ncbi:DUF3173 family protein [Companilactobacillus mishanensis]|uniref:DUF3173 domain-containing protein n=1 Tax=Companilactobacillus mishanensis TaxID=2486008 RepID=A0ABW9P6C2_9LACO|nr:DUF3173 family protein [Companilactobacillus mishanensis]MQS44612.1 DUF3173 domain-containing protein [Companilactobacillus mishanensis]